MNKDQVLAISSLTTAQREAAERWFKVPFNREKEIKGTQSEVKAFLNNVITKHNLLVKQKNKRIEKYGSLKEVVSKVNELCKGAKSAFTFKEILNIIDSATKQKQAEIEEIRNMENELKERKKALGIK